MSESIYHRIPVNVCQYNCMPVIVFVFVFVFVCTCEFICVHLENCLRKNCVH